MDPPRKVSARLTGCLKLNTVMWLLRCSVLRGTPMPGARDPDFKKLKCYQFWRLLEGWVTKGAEQV
jgi:hypothetical protein